MDSTQSLHGRVALVGGASQGIGRAIALALAGRGARVILSGRNDEGLTKVLGELPAVEAGAHEVLLQDHADAPAMERAADALVARLGAVHIFVANSGGPAPGFLIDAPTADIERALRQHVSGAHGVLQALAPGMRAAGFGRVVAVTSTSVIAPIRGLGVSNVVRAAMSNWIRTIAGELGRFGITANMVMPGSTKTGRLDAIFQGRAARAGTSVAEIEREAIARIPAGRLGQPEEIAAVVAFLCSPAAAFVNGTMIPVDGGQMAVQG
jgi:3-oxoacyl-[acyl-carrier protein] reductase